MDNKLAQKYTELTTKIDELKAAKVAATTNIERYKEQHDEALKNILKLTNTSSFEEAIEKKTKLDERVKALYAEAEALFDEWYC